MLQSTIRLLRSAAAVAMVPRAARAASFVDKAGSSASQPPQGPPRHRIQWKHPEFYDEKALEQEMRRVFEVCHGCRACFNLCDSFPKLFELIDQSPSGELQDVPSTSFKPVADKCTLCDMCYTANCPYVPPHELNIDFPHLILRYRAVEQQKANSANVSSASGTTSKSEQQEPFHWPHATEVQHVEPGVSRSLVFQPQGAVHRFMTDIDTVASAATLTAPLTNWTTQPTGSINHSDKPPIQRQIIESMTGIDARASLPPFVPASQTLLKQAERDPVLPNPEAPAFKAGRKVVLYGTCLSNYCNPDIGLAARRVLAHNGVHVDVVYPECCGMPQLEQGLIKNVNDRAERIASVLVPFIQQGFKVVTVVASCALMLKKEWPLLSTSDNVKLLADNTFDVSEYVMELSRTEGLVAGRKPLDGAVSLHHACHARAQNMGFKARDMLKLIPSTLVMPMERCSGHGGSWGAELENFDTALKVGKPAFKAILKDVAKAESAQTQAPPAVDSERVHYVASDCPLAQDHLVQGVHLLEQQHGSKLVKRHPIELLAMSYGLYPTQ